MTSPGAPVLFTSIRVPSLKAFAPKPWSPGETVTVSGYTGTVWSDGPVPGSVWVAINDNTSTMAAVKKETKTRDAHILRWWGPGGESEAATRSRVTDAAR